MKALSNVVFRRRQVSIRSELITFYAVAHIYVFEGRSVSDRQCRRCISASVIYHVYHHPICVWHV